MNNASALKCLKNVAAISQARARHSLFLFSTKFYKNNKKKGKKNKLGIHRFRLNLTYYYNSFYYSLLLLPFSIPHSIKTLPFDEDFILLLTSLHSFNEKHFCLPLLFITFLVDIQKQNKYETKFHFFFYFFLCFKQKVF